MLAALPYTLGDIATVIPPEWKPKVVIVGLVATIGLRFWSAITDALKPQLEEEP